MRRTEVANNPAAHRRTAQPCSRSTPLCKSTSTPSPTPVSCAGRIYSGFGGQPDFVSGALHSRGGQAVLALRSWHEKSDASNIVPLLTDPVCSFQHSVIVTEQGVAPIFGFSQQSQARSLIDHAAHPRAREELSAGGPARCTCSVRTEPTPGSRLAAAPSRQMRSKTSSSQAKGESRTGQCTTTSSKPSSR